MFVKLFAISLILFEICNSSVIKDDKYLHLFRVEASTIAAPPKTDAATPAPATRTTYDWGQWTKTQAPGSRTTYDWGQWTDPSRTTYNWGQHTDPTRTTYNWGQWTSTSGPHNGDDNETTTEKPNDWEYQCGAGKYKCKGTVTMCIKLEQICDGKQNCPHRDDEDPNFCYPGLNGGNRDKKRDVNSFSGTGFMWRIKNIVIESGSEGKIFNQQSDNGDTGGEQAMINYSNNGNEAETKNVDQYYRME